MKIMNNKSFVNTYLKSKETTTSIKLDYIVALLPMVLWSIIRHKISALILISLSLFVSLLCDFVFRSIIRKKLTSPSLSVVYYSLILSAMFFEKTSVLYAVVSGFLLTVIIHLWGGITKCFVCPPVIALLITSSILSVGLNAPDNTPFNSIISGSSIPSESNIEFLLGINSAPIGAGAILAVVVGGLYLLIRKAADFKCSVVYILLILGLTFAFPFIEGRGMESIVYELLTSEVLFVFFFILTDIATTPENKANRYLKGALCALITFINLIVLRSSSCFYISVVITELVFPFIVMLQRKLMIAKEGKNER